MSIVPFVLQGQHNLARGKGQCLHHVSKGGKNKEIAVWLLIPIIIRELRWKLYLKAKGKTRKLQEEGDWKAVFGKTERTV
ncbi:MAG: hypothetical protein V3U15_02720 [Nitrospinota bacterium]